MPRIAVAQGTTNPPAAVERSPGVQLGQNYPNPFNPATTIPFTIGDPPGCTADGGQQHRVTLRVYNVLAQLVAIPVLRQGSGVGEGQPAVDVTLACGTYTAYWDGRYMSTSQEVPSGVYIYLLEVDGRSIGKKMIMMR
ncbi:MAG TPA: hypothetical protein VIQ60_13920 [Gemmatimonadaceae bacterium]